MSNDFQPGTTSKITAAAAFELLAKAIKNEGVEAEGVKRGNEISSIRPIFNPESSQGKDSLLGFELSHGTPKPRKDKGIPRGPRTVPAQTDAKDAKVEPKKVPASPFAAGDAKQAAK